jgi:glucosamine-6-phosphate deaminase
MSPGMKLRPSSISADWWDYTCLPLDLVHDVARLSVKDLAQLSRPGFTVVMYDTLEDFYLAEALEYIAAWKASTPDNPVGICGPIGPTEQLPLVARLVNELGLDIRSGHFWGMDEWFDVETGKEVPASHPLSFERADREMCFGRINKKLRMPDGHSTFPKQILRPIQRALMQG